jgi:flagellar biosynthetic protein FliR
MQVHVNLHDLAVYLSVLLRISLVLFMTPTFSSVHVPANVKAVITFVIANLIYLVAGKQVAPLPFEPIALAEVVIAEIVFGLIMALSINMVFAAFEFAGELLSFQMGFGFAQLADPQSGVRIGFLSGWFQMVATLLLFSLNGHHFIIRAIVQSFQTIPVGGFNPLGVTLDRIVSLSASIFVIGIKISAPALIALLMTQVGFGLMSKFAPQVNILTTSMPVTIMLGFLFLSLSVSIWIPAMESYLAKLMQFLHLLVNR